MRKIREVLPLKHGCGLTNRQIGKTQILQAPGKTDGGWTWSEGSANQNSDVVIP